MSLEVSVRNQASGSSLYLCPFKSDKDCSSIMYFSLLGWGQGLGRVGSLALKPREKLTTWERLSCLCCQVSFFHIIKENFKSSISQPVRVLWWCPHVMFTCLRLHKKPFIFLGIKNYKCMIAVFMFWRTFLVKGHWISFLLLQKEEMEPRSGVRRNRYLLKIRKHFP